MPHIWCPGCGIGTTVNCFARALTDSGLDLDKVAIVSGIGCTGRVAGYLNLDSFHTTHGRAIPFATGLKLANPDLEGRGLLRRRRPLGDRRQPPHPRRAPQHGPDGRLRQQLHLRHDRRPGRADDADRRDPDDDAVRQLREPVQPAVPGRRVRRGLRGALDRLPRPAARQGDARGPARRRASSSSRPWRRARRSTRGATGSATASTSSSTTRRRARSSTAPTRKDVGLTFQGDIVVGKFVDRERPTWLDAMNEHYTQHFGEKYTPYGGSHGQD